MIIRGLVIKKKKQKLPKRRIIIPKEFLEEHRNIKAVKSKSEQNNPMYTAGFYEVFEKIV